MIVKDFGTLYNVHTLALLMRIKNNATRKAVKIILTFRLVSSNLFDLNCDHRLISR